MAFFTISTSEFFDLNLKYLYYVGLWPELLNQNWPPFIRWLYRIFDVTLTIFSVCYLTLTGIGMYMVRHDVIKVLTDMDKSIVAYNFAIKTIIFLFKQKRISVLVSEIILSGDKMERKRKKQMKTHVLSVCAMTSSITIYYAIRGLIKGEMAIDAWMPFDPLKDRWSLLLASQILAIFFLVPIIWRAVFVQGIVCSLVWYLCDQLIELQSRLKRLTVKNEELLRKEFREIITKHIRLVGYSISMKSELKEYFLVQNMAVTTEVCLNALMASLVGFHNTDLLISFLALLTVALINAYIFCSLGNNLMDESAGIATAAYDSTWTSWPLDMQKDLLIMVTVAQRSFELSAGGISSMTMETFSQALYNGYSIFAVLRDILN